MSLSITVSPAITVLPVTIRIPSTVVSPSDVPPKTTKSSLVVNEPNIVPPDNDNLVLA